MIFIHFFPFDGRFCIVSWGFLKTKFLDIHGQLFFVVGHFLQVDDGNRGLVQLSCSCFYRRGVSFRWQNATLLRVYTWDLHKGVNSYYPLFFGLMKFASDIMKPQCFNQPAYSYPPKKKLSWKLNITGEVRIGTSSSPGFTAVLKKFLPIHLYNQSI